MKNTHGEIATCEPSNIIPIIPCRYVISDDMLLTPLDELPDALQTPAGIGQSPHHQIATLRQGYIYFYGHLGSSTEHCADAEKKWMVFRYQTRADDCNSDHEPTACASSFQYYNYQWRNGRAGSEWIANPMVSEPFAYLNTGARRMYIAYSEERWPAYLFTAISENPSLADKVMQPFTLYEEDGADPHVMKLDTLMASLELDENEAGDGEAEDEQERSNALIEDFKNIQPENREANVLRHTPIGNLDITPFVRLKRRSHQDPYENARIVVIQDTLGEAKDLLRLLAVEEANIQHYETNHHYAIETAQLIAAYEEAKETMERRDAEKRAGAHPWSIHNEPNPRESSGRRFFNRDPFNRAADPMRHKLATYGTRQRRTYQKLVDYWRSLDQRPQVYEVTRLALQRAEEKQCEACLGFAASQLVAYLEGSRLNALSPDVIKEMLTLDDASDKKDGKPDALLVPLLGLLVNVTSKIIDHVFDPMVKEVIHQLFFETYLEVAQVIADDNGVIVERQLKKMTGVIEAKTPIPMSELERYSEEHIRRILTAELHSEEHIRRMLTDELDRTKHAENVRAITHTSSTLHHTTLDYHHYVYEHSTPMGKSNLGLSGVGMVFAFLGTYKTLKEWNATKPFDERSSLAYVANLPAIQLSASFLAAVSAVTSITTDPVFHDLRQQSARAANRLATRFKVYNGGNNRAIAPPRPTAGVASSAMKRYTVFARVMGTLATTAGVFISIAQTHEGHLIKDYNLMTGHALQGVGGILMTTGLVKKVGAVLVASKVGGLVLVGTLIGKAIIPIAILGGVMVAFGFLFAAFRRSDMERWIYEGFWGSSGQYWGKDRARIFGVQLEDSKKLFEDDATELRDFFDQEIRLFEQINWLIEVAPTGKGQGELWIQFPGLTDAEQVSQLHTVIYRREGRFTLGWEMIYPQYSQIPKSNLATGASPQLTWVAPGVAVMNLADFIDQPKLSIKITYPRVLPDGTLQHFQMPEHYVIDKPSEL